MVHRVLILVLMERGFGQEVWIIQFDHGIFEKDDNYSNTTLTHKSSRLVTVQQVIT